MNQDRNRLRQNIRCCSQHLVWERIEYDELATAPSRLSCSQHLARERIETTDRDNTGTYNVAPST